MKYNVVIDSDQVADLASLFPLRNRRKREVELAVKQYKDYETLRDKSFKDSTFLQRLAMSAKLSNLDLEVKKAENLYLINESTMHVILDDLEMFLNDIEKQIKSKE